MNEAMYVVNCPHCQAPFDALEAPWCSCLTNERTLVCPTCVRCACSAPAAYKQFLWRGAPAALRERHSREHKVDDTWSNPEPGEAARPLVLVLDDEPDIRRIATRLISALGFGVVVGRSGSEGLLLARRYRPDLVLADALMPGLDGRELALQIKQDPQLAATPVVVMTSLYTAAKYRNQAFNAYRVDDYLAKPLDLGALRSLLEKQLHARGAA